MIDPKLLREQPEIVARNLARRDAAFDTAAYAELEARRKKWQVRVEEAACANATNSPSRSARPPAKAVTWTRSSARSRRPRMA